MFCLLGDDAAHGRFPSGGSTIERPEAYPLAEEYGEVPDPFNMAGLGIREVARARRDDGSLATLARQGDDNGASAATLSMMSLRPTAGEVADGLERCMVCLETVDSPVSFRCREHWLCQACASSYLRAALSAGREARCPAPNCGAVAGTRLPRRALPDKEYEQYLLLGLRSRGKVRKCPKCDLDMFLDVGSKDAELEDTDIIPARCPGCRGAFCLACGLPWHPSRFCEEALEMQRHRQDDARRAAFEKSAVELGLKSCPGCSAPVEKYGDGCDHMTCASCGTEFCWTCMADRRVIAAHGNHFHKSDCKFFFPYDAAPEFLPARCHRCKRRGRPCTPPRKPKLGRREM
eukprot:TRINITY_DN28657_c0_g1_i2.p1 TRINITY_DN28657_c0_g1~~TRINITY_DN28657_c0_g1_i2.p1  ORF type:complete len:386 (+),score=58.74 TRINITY_DN28657_c0_g1_i2:119-1159(+)